MVMFVVVVVFFGVGKSLKLSVCRFSILFYSWLCLVYLCVLYSFFFGQFFFICVSSVWLLCVRVNVLVCYSNVVGRGLFYFFGCMVILMRNQLGQFLECGIVVFVRLMSLLLCRVRVCLNVLLGCCRVFRCWMFLGVVGDCGCVVFKSVVSCGKLLGVVGWKFMLGRWGRGVFMYQLSSVMVFCLYVIWLSGF